MKSIQTFLKELLELFTCCFLEGVNYSYFSEYENETQSTKENVDCITDSTYNLDDTDQSFIIKDEESSCISDEETHSYFVKYEHKAQLEENADCVINIEPDDISDTDRTVIIKDEKSLNISDDEELCGEFQLV